jgi:lipoprotein-anchoring transpeptidase ErfK/SrfK
MLFRCLLLAVLAGAVAYTTPPLESTYAAAIRNSGEHQIALGAHGPAVVHAQILLGRAHFSCGAIDGEFGSNLQKTVTAYQNEQQLPATGAVDTATWAALNTDEAPPLTSYTITADDEEGPFVQIPKDFMMQARLPAMGYTSPLQELAERFHSSEQLLQALNPEANFRLAGQELKVPNTTTTPPGPAASISVSKSESSVRAYDSDGNLLAFYVATIGSEHDPLPVGEWEVLGIKHDPVFHYDSDLFWDAQRPGEKADIQPGPNNPVGLVWITLSKEHVGIHGTPNPALIGHAKSHGCIRLTNWDALELSTMVSPGTPVSFKE